MPASLFSLPRVLCITLLLLPIADTGAQEPRATEAKPAAAPVAAVATWDGVYRGENFELELKSDGLTGLAYVLRFPGNQIFSASAQADGNRVTGLVRQGAETAPFELIRKGEEFYFVAAGRTFLVRHQGKPGTAPVTPAPGTAATPAAAPPAAESNPTLADATPEAQWWLEKLRGKRVRQFWASQGMSSDKSHWLNRDGTYRFQSSSMVSVDVAGASGLSTGADATTGRWRIRDLAGELYLEIRYNNGTERRLRLRQGKPNWTLNGEKAFAVDP